MSHTIKNFKNDILNRLESLDNSAEVGTKICPKIYSQPKNALTLKNCCNLKAPAAYDYRNSVAATPWAHQIV